MKTVNAIEINDHWETFPATMGENRVWISYNQSYSKIAKSDSRNNSIQIRIKIKKPTEYGMPTNEEFPALLSLDESLEVAITDIGGIYVGRLTVGGYRYFYYYVARSEKNIKNIVTNMANSSKYKIQMEWSIDPKKKEYWNNLYPTSDDIQVIQDMKVLDALMENGDLKDRKREVQHWAYFAKEDDSNKFKDWILEQGYMLVFSGLSEKQDYLIKYTHNGTMHLSDITHHTIKSNRMARKLEGRYDGWETSVEK